VVQRDRQLDHPQIRGQVTAAPRDGVDQPAADFLRQFLQLLS
jgi:hypothetical protein